MRGDRLNSILEITFVSKVSKCPCNETTKCVVCRPNFINYRRTPIQQAQNILHVTAA